MRNLRIDPAEAEGKLRSLIQKTSQITTTLDSPRGSFAILVSALAKNHIRIRAFQLDGNRARIVVDDPQHNGNQDSARGFIERLWRHDQIVFDASKQ